MRQITQTAAKLGTCASLVAIALVGGCARAAAPSADAAQPPSPAPADPTATRESADPTASAVTASGTPAPTMLTLAPPPPTTAPAPDATTSLIAALDALATGYHFTVTSTVGEQVAFTAEGDHVAGATQMTVTSGGTTTEYLVTADAAWARDAGTWRRLDSTQGLTDPISQLRAPRSVELVGTLDAATITAEYPAAALGVRGHDARTVVFHLAKGLITSVRFDGTAVVTDADGTPHERPSDVTAVITPIAPGTQITLPSSGP